MYAQSVDMYLTRLRESKVKINVRMYIAHCVTRDFLLLNTSSVYKENVITSYTMIYFIL